jgi:hypothetical protein
MEYGRDIYDPRARALYMQTGALPEPQLDLPVSV